MTAEPKPAVKYSPELAAHILRSLRLGHSLRSICRGDNMPAEATVRQWVEYNTQDFAEPYEKARIEGYLTYADEIIDIADDGSNDWMQVNGKSVLDGEHVQRSRLRVDTRKWVLANMLPKLFGNKVQHTGADGSGPVATEVVYRWADPPKE